METDTIEAWRYRGVWGLVLLVVGLHLVAGGIYPEVIWGAHHAGFYSAWVQVLLYLPVFAVALPRVNASICRGLGRLEAVGARLPGWAWCALVAISGAWLFTSFQLQHSFFGDNLARVGELKNKMELSGWSYQYDSLIRNRLHHLFRFWWGWEAGQSYAFLSISYGVVFLLGGLGLARHLGRTLGERLLLLGGLVSSGFLLLFFGYAEVYNSVVAATVLFLWALLAYVGGQCRVWVPVVAAMVMGLLHILSLFALPALVYAVVRRHGWDRLVPGRGRSWLVPVWVAGSVVAGWAIFQLVQLTSPIPIFEDSPDIPYTVFAPAHLLDMANEQLLVALPGWLGLFLGGLLSRGRRRDVYLDVLMVAAVVSGFMWGLVNPALGSLDWDLMSLPAAAWVVLGLYYLVLRTRGSKALGYGGLVLVVLSLVHTTPWIALQQDPPRAIQAVEAMVVRDPHMYGFGLRGGIAGMLGVRLLQEGHEAAAGRLMERVLEEGTADDVLSLRTFCQIYITEKRYDEIEPLLQRVLRILPDRTTIKLLRAFRQQAPDGRAKSTRMLEEVISVFPHPTYFGVLAEFYRKEGRDQDLIRLVRQLDQAIVRTEVQAAAAPGSGKTHLDLGALYLRRGRVAEARSSLLKARELRLYKDQRAAVEELLQVIEDLESRPE